MITIHYDFTDGTEVSYQQGLELKDNFTTCCLDFFNMDLDVDDIVVVKKDGGYVSRKHIHLSTSKEIRKAHNIHKMLVAGSFNWIYGDAKDVEADNFHKIKLAIKLENLMMLSADDRNDVDCLKKLLAWQDDYCDEVDWREFYDKWYHCDDCGSYVEGGCMCYSR